MKKLLALLGFGLACALCPSAATAGSIVTFVINDLDTDEEQVLVYPGGTTYEVLDKQGQPYEPSKADGGAKFYDPGKYTLVVYPSYRPKKGDRIQIKGDRLRVFETPGDAKRYGYAKNWQESKITLNHDDGKQYVSRPYGIERKYKTEAKLEKKIVVASEKSPGQYNLKMYFKNGLQFHYIDGKATAMLNGKPQIVEGKYIVHTDLGTAKISFNPEDGQVYWVFLKNKEDRRAE